MGLPRTPAFSAAWRLSGLLAALALGACHGATARDVRALGEPAPRDAAPAPVAPSTISDAPFARPIQFVSVAERRLHLHCMGSGSPTIVLEAGLGGDSSGWVRVEPRLAQTTKVCAYDRAGYYFSDPGPAPRTADVAVADLHGLLQAASIRAPIVLVGHSLGGLLVRLYAATYPADVTGMVLLDPALDNIEDSQSPKESDQGEEDPLFVKCLGAARNGTIKTDAALREACIGPPDARLSPELNAAQAEAAARVSTWETMLSEGKEMRSGRTGARVRAAPEKLERLPLVVVTKGRIRTPPADEVKIVHEYYGRTVLRHAELAGRSQLGLHIVARSGHQMHMDDPDTVVAAVEVVLRAWRDNRGVRP